MALRDATELLASDVLDLVEGRCSAIRIKHYYPDEECREVLRRILGSVDPKRESPSKIYLTNVTPFYNTIGNAAAQKLYFENSLNAVRALRHLCSPLLSPVDAVRLDLEEMWPEGCDLMKMNGQNMFFGITRIWQTGSEGLPHQDLLQRELDDAVVGGLQGQMGLNIYLETADEGGELEVWDYYVSEDQMRSQGVMGSYGYNRATLPEPACVLKPERGDLILINTVHVHAIAKIHRGRRTTLSGFVGFWGRDEKLTLWT